MVLALICSHDLGASWAFSHQIKLYKIQVSIYSIFDPRMFTRGSSRRYEKSVDTPRYCRVPCFVYKLILPLLYLLEPCSHPIFRYLLLALGKTSTFPFHINWCSIIKKSLIFRPHSDWHSPFQLPLWMPCKVPKPLAIRSASFIHHMGGAKTLGNSQPSGNLTSSAGDPPSHLFQFTEALGMPALRHSRIVGVGIYPVAWNILLFVRRYFIGSGIPQGNKSTQHFMAIIPWLESAHAAFNR
jgi:hypothetical protein